MLKNPKILGNFIFLVMQLQMQKNKNLLQNQNLLLNGFDLFAISTEKRYTVEEPCSQILSRNCCFTDNSRKIHHVLERLCLIC